MHSRISAAWTVTVFGTPETRSLPFTGISPSSSEGHAEPISILMRSAVGSPTCRL